MYNNNNHHCFSTAKMVARTRLNITLYVHCVSCLILRFNLHFVINKNCSSNGTALVSHELSTRS